jgi:hypothetical protein
MRAVLEVSPQGQGNMLAASGSRLHTNGLLREAVLRGDSRILGSLDAANYVR